MGYKDYLSDLIFSFHIFLELFIICFLIIGNNNYNSLYITGQSARVVNDNCSSNRNKTSLQKPPMGFGNKNNPKVEIYTCRTGLSKS